MEKKKTCKFAALAISTIALILTLFVSADWRSVGVYVGCPLYCRAIYHIFHANIVHAAINAWCLLSIVFIYNISIKRLLLAFCAAASVPAFCLSVTPTVGLSGVVYFLLGSLSFEVARFLYYQFWMALFIALGFFIPNSNALLHLYCYAVGFAVALLNKPIKIKVE